VVRVPTDPPIGPNRPDASSSWDDALQRLEDVLLAYPTDRAVPDLQQLLDEVDLPEGFLLEDDRALKLLRDAIHTRPLASVDEVSRLRTEVELLTLEARVITERLTTGAAGATGPSARADTDARLERIRHRLAEIQRLL
jgi:hypothetical protein